MGKAAKLDVTTAVRMANMKAAAKNDSRESVLGLILKRAKEIHADMSLVLEEAMNNTAEAEFNTHPRRTYRKTDAN